MSTKVTSIPIYAPNWDSNLTTTIIELEKLRIKKLGGPVPPYIFFQIKTIFHILESIGSARIEGNHTTLSEFVEKIITKETSNKDESLQEINNINTAIKFIEENVDKNTKINRAFISQIHSILVKDLSLPPYGEGSRNPGQLRSINVVIQNSEHTPPDALHVPEYLDELIIFINDKYSAQYHLLVMAIAHHRLAWLHPFDNGNGRLVRMITYALLIQQGFQVKSGRILNPTAIFCMDRNEYYDKLSLADKGDRDGVLSWCEYVLNGLQQEIQKIDKLLDLQYIVDIILLPVLSYGLDQKYITKSEHTILSALVKKPDMTIKAGDLVNIIGENNVYQRTRIIKKLKDKNMLIPIKDHSQIYTLGFTENFLTRGVIKVLEQQDFIPSFLNDNS
jgi:Fic family protein